MKGLFQSRKFASNHEYSTSVSYIILEKLSHFSQGFNESRGSSESPDNTGRYSEPGIYIDTVLRAALAMVMYTTAANTECSTDSKKKIAFQGDFT